MKKNIITTLILLVAAMQTIVAQNVATLDKIITEIGKNPSMQHASMGVCIYNASQGKPVYAYNSQLSMVPASVNKIFSTGVAFANLGAQYRFRTTLCYTGTIDAAGTLKGDLYIVGGGDPLLGSYRYRQTAPDTLFAVWTEAMRKRGIKKVEGRILYDNSAFDNQPVNDSWEWSDVGNYYGAGAYGLNFHENMYFVHFNAPKRLGAPATVARTRPKNLPLRANNGVVAGPENSGDGVMIYGSPYSDEKQYIGTVPMGKTDFAVRGALSNPGRTCAEQFANHLRNHGIGVSSSIDEGVIAADSVRTIIDYYSSPYYMIAQYTNQTSNNVYAESIFKMLGYAAYGKGSYENGARAVTEYFKAHNLESSGVRIVDGSGLSRKNRTTPDFVCRYLTEMAQSDVYADFANSLAEVGKSGTVKNLLPTLPKNITIRMKTGTIEGVKTYAGYITKANGELLTFAIMMNNFDGKARNAAAHMNRLLQAAATTE